MTYADVVSQVQTIQTRLVQLGLVKPASSTLSASSFASALDGASATAVAGSATTSATASTDGTLISAGGVTGNDVVQAALAYKGVPYVLGGESKSGIDCSGLVQAAFGDLGVSVPRLVHEQETVGQPVASLKDAKPGDLIVLNGNDHIAIWMGDGTAIHAPYPGRTVSVQKAWFDDSDITTIRRVVPATGDQSAAAAVGGTASSGAASSGAASAGAAMLGAGVSGLGLSGLDMSGGVSEATKLKAAAMLSTSGADVGLYSASGASGSSAGASLGSLLASFGLSGTSSTTGSSSTSAQQIIAARAALLGTSA